MAWSRLQSDKVVMVDDSLQDGVCEVDRKE